MLGGSESGSVAFEDFPHPAHLLEVLQVHELHRRPNLCANHDKTIQLQTLECVLDRGPTDPDLLGESVRAEIGSRRKGSVQDLIPDECVRLCGTVGSMSHARAQGGKKASEALEGSATWARGRLRELLFKVLSS
jgi:hypothetical protein